MCLYASNALNVFIYYSLIYLSVVSLMILAIIQSV